MRSCVHFGVYVFRSNCNQNAYKYSDMHEQSTKGFGVHIAPGSA